MTRLHDIVWSKQNNCRKLHSTTTSYSLIRSWTRLNYKYFLQLILFFYVTTLGVYGDTDVIYPQRPSKFIFNIRLKSKALNVPYIEQRRKRCGSASD